MKTTSFRKYSPLFSGRRWRSRRVGGLSPLHFALIRKSSNSTTFRPSQKSNPPFSDARTALQKRKPSTGLALSSAIRYTIFARTASEPKALAWATVGFVIVGKSDWKPGWARSRAPRSRSARLRRTPISMAAKAAAVLKNTPPRSKHGREEIRKPRIGLGTGPSKTTPSIASSGDCHE